MSLVLLIVIALIAVSFVAFFIVGYNSIVRKEQQVKNAFSSIDVQLNRIAEQLPNLVNVVKGAGVLESKTLTQIADAYGKYAGALKSSSDPNTKIKAAATFFGTVMPIILQLPQYPQLQSIQQFQQLYNEIKVSIDKIAYAREFYNSAVQDYNLFILSFPWIIIAKLMGKKPYEYFEYERKEETRRALETGEITKILTQI